MLPLACPSSTSAMPSWAVASWVCPTQWPTLASPYLCEFFFSISAFYMQAGRGRKWWFYADTTANTTSKVLADLTGSSKYRKKMPHWHNTQLRRGRCGFVCCVKVTGSKVYKSSLLQFKNSLSCLL